MVSLKQRLNNLNGWQRLWIVFSFLALLTSLVAATTLGCLKWLLALDRFLDSKCQSRLSYTWWRSIFNEQGFIQARQLQPIGILTTS